MRSQAGDEVFSEIRPLTGAVFVGPAGAVVADRIGIKQDAVGDSAGLVIGLIDRV